jgi:hypothetical protein
MIDRDFVVLYGIRFDATQFCKLAHVDHLYDDALERYTDGVRGETLSVIGDNHMMGFRWVYAGHEIARIDHYDECESHEIKAGDALSIIAEIREKLGIPLICTSEPLVKLWFFNVIS